MPEIRSFFSSYARIPVATSIPFSHILNGQDELTSQHFLTCQIRPYHCLSAFVFIDFILRSFPQYLIHLSNSPLRLQNNPRFPVCWFGRDLRCLARDCVLISSFIAVDLLSNFWEVEIELSKDWESMRHARFIVGILS
jgi:hypothetical protein